MNDIEKNNRTRNLHNEMHQIIVSKRELYYQFDNFSEQDNLLALFSCRPDCADYNRILNLLGAKFELIGSFNYVSKVGGKEHLMGYQEIKKLLDKILVGCVITKEEDQKLKANGLKQKMPKDGTDILEIAKNPWARYKECEIEVFEIKWENKEIQQKNSLSF